MAEAYKDIREMRYGQTSSRRTSSKKVTPSELCHIGYTEFEKKKKTPSKREAMNLDAPAKTRGQLAVYFTLVHPLDKNLEQQVRGVQTLGALPRRYLRRRHGGCAGRQGQVLPDAHLGCVICFDATPQKGDPSETFTNTRVAVGVVVTVQKLGHHAVEKKQK